MKKITIHHPAYYSILLLVLIALVAGSCKKDKVSNTIPLQNVGNQSASSIRMFNFSGFPANITVNNIPLTSYGSTIGQGTTLGLSLFPTGGWTAGDDGSPFTMPNILLDKDGKAHIIIGGGLAGNTLIDTTIVNNVAHPQDYYLVSAGAFQVNGHFKIINRSNLPPVNPQNFRIRIINLGSATDAFGLNGPVSLTYADGSQVDPTLNNIALGATSGYVDIPYGTYQFKLFVTNGTGIIANRQLAELPTIVHLDPCALSVIQPQEGLTPRVRTFKPGGVYSLVITQNLLHYLTCGDNQNAYTVANSYRVITELDPGVNSTYARMQAVNAIPGKQVTINVDGAELGNQLPYIGSLSSIPAQQPPYKIYVQGSHHIQAVDQNGTVLAEGDLKLFPYDNYTIWAYNKPDGKPAVLFEPNDMSGSIYNSVYQPGGPTQPVIPDDGTNGIPRRGQYFYALESRFLNLSPDLPYLTFTNDHQLFTPAVNTITGDTTKYYSAYVNLAPGMLPLNNPSIIYSLQPATVTSANVSFETPPQNIRVYESTPGKFPEIPGALLPDIAPVNVLQTFISNPNLYTTTKYKIAETGIYTVALVGKTFTATKASEKARIVVIKHSK
jgi:hypothetical protein